jgi:DNA-3-methyladenine glycosylase
LDTEKLARFLIGKTLVHDHPAGRLSGRIVETEAYPPGDPAGHSYRGRTAANGSLWLDRGHAYVYLIYGRYFMMNVASGRRGVGCGVLLRALEPLEGVALMERRDGRSGPKDLARGPGLLARAMRIDRHFDGVDLCGGGRLWLGAAVRPAGPIAASIRIGLTRAADRKLRFYELGSPFVSGPRRLAVLP